MAQSIILRYTGGGCSGRCIRHQTARKKNPPSRFTVTAMVQLKWWMHSLWKKSTRAGLQVVGEQITAEPVRQISGMRSGLCGGQRWTRLGPMFVRVGGGMCTLPAAICNAGSLALWRRASGKLGAWNKMGGRKQNDRRDNPTHPPIIDRGVRTVAKHVQLDLNTVHETTRKVNKVLQSEVEQLAGSTFEHAPSYRGSMRSSSINRALCPMAGAYNAPCMISNVLDGKCTVAGGRLRRCAMTINSLSV
ncbi:hypothetical protein B0H13DRAFT_1877183 [Mycena leptocephala]|nr:hypothetical protein B0H13DRAFT_1877183 [Mycena leptocephala]